MNRSSSGGGNRKVNSHRNAPFAMTETFIHIDEVVRILVLALISHVHGIEAIVVNPVHVSDLQTGPDIDEPRHHQRAATRHYHICNRP